MPRGCTRTDPASLEPRQPLLGEQVIEVLSHQLRHARARASLNLPPQRERLVVPRLADMRAGVLVVKA
ncbi:MAG: hypothetical protein ACOC0P_02815 [Planctomycetota bacterium]